MSRAVLVGTRCAALWVCALVVAACLGGAAAQAGAESLVVLNCTDTPDMNDLIGRLEQAGGTARHIFPPHVLIAELTFESEQVLAADPRVDLIADGYVDPGAIPAEYGLMARDAVTAWDRVYVYPEPSPQRDPSSLPEPLVGDTMLPLDELLGTGGGPETAAAPPGATSSQTSEYLMGSVVISLIFVESDGSIDTPQTENWTAGEQTNVLTETLAGANYWVGRYPYTVAPVSFTWVYNYNRQTGYEPIGRPHTDEGLWASQVLTGLGYTCTSSTYLTAARTCANDLRNNNNKDWAFLVFLVDSSADLDGMFTDNWFGYAYVGGPMMVMTYDNDNWGISDMDKVFAHEIAHIFRAGDEYCQVGYSCCNASLYLGYLRIQNTNCNTGVKCIMNDPTVDTLSNMPVCSVSGQQLGWRDNDADGVPDILDCPPTASLNAYAPDPTTDNTPTYTGTAAVSKYPNQLYTGLDVTLNRISNVQYRVDGGSWQNCTASDGTFDGGTESFTFTTSALSAGTHTIEARALDTSGNLSTSYGSDTITIASSHTVNVSAVAVPLTVSSGGTASLTGVASDTLLHGIASWSWNDGGAGGSFNPSASVQNPSYTAPINLTGANQAVTLTLTATCVGPSPVSGSGSVVLTVKSDPVAEVEATQLPSALKWNQQAAVSVTYHNVGSLTWTTAGGYALLSAGGVDRWGVTSVALPGSVAPDATCVFAFDITAPPITTLVYTPPVTATAAVPSADTLTCAWEMGRSGSPLLGDIASTAVTISRFPDIQPGTSGAWARSWIEECAGRVPAIVGGYEDGTYRPSIEVDRASMAVYLARALKLPTAEYQTLFRDDVPQTHWAWPWIEALKRADLVGGFDATHYRPEVIVNRDAMAVFVARGMVGGINVPTGPDAPTFEDVPTSHWAYDEVEYCFAHGVVGGYDPTHYWPDFQVTRDQMAVFVYRGFIQPTEDVVVLGGPAITAVDPGSASYWGWSSLASGPASDPGYAYVVLDPVRLGSHLADVDSFFDVFFELRGPETPTPSHPVSLSASDLQTIHDGACTTGAAYHALSWNIPAGLTAGEYTLVVSAEDEPGVMHEIARKPTFTIAP